MLKVSWIDLDNNDQIWKTFSIPSANDQFRFR